MHKKIIFIIFLFYTPFVLSDGITIGKIYHPYVQQLEKEIEYRLTHHVDPDNASNHLTRHTLGFGYALSDDYFIELYLKGDNSQHEKFDVEALELEFKWQLSEQGEYSNDYGLLFELEKEFEENSWESVMTFIALHQWQRWVGTVNLSLIYEWGSDINNEFETSASAQLRYRYRPFFEPAIELYASQDTRGIGPVFTGQQRIYGKQKLFWEAGLIVGVNDTTPDLNWKFNIEYEF